MIIKILHSLNQGKVHPLETPLRNIFYRYKWGNNPGVTHLDSDGPGWTTLLYRCGILSTASAVEVAANSFPKRADQGRLGERPQVIDRADAHRCQFCIQLVSHSCRPHTRKLIQRTLLMQADRRQVALQCTSYSILPLASATSCDRLY